MYQWNKRIEFDGRVFVKTLDCFTNVSTPELTHLERVGALIWNASQRAWIVGIRGGFFTTDQGTYRKPPKELVELLVAARGS